MKNVTPPLINQKMKRNWKSFFVGEAAKQAHYAARHKVDDIYILWIEAVQFGKTNCYPCVLEEKGDAMVYLSGNHTKNKEMLKRWNLFVTPQNINREFDVSELDKHEFQKIYRRYQENLREKQELMATTGMSEEDIDDMGRFSEFVDEMDADPSSDEEKK